MCALLSHIIVPKTHSSFPLLSCPSKLSLLPSILHLNHWQPCYYWLIHDSYTCLYIALYVLPFHETLTIISDQIFRHNAYFHCLLLYQKPQSLNNVFHTATNFWQKFWQIPISASLLIHTGIEKAASWQTPINIQLDFFSPTYPWNHTI